MLSKNGSAPACRNYSTEDLAGFTAGDLDQDVAKRLVAHMAECETCQKEQRDLNDMWLRAQELRSLTPPTGLREKIANSVAGSINATKQSRRRTVMVWRAALAAGACAVAALALLMIPPRQDGRNIAFADVESAMAKVSVVSCIEATDSYHQAGAATVRDTTLVNQIWIRRSPPALEVINLSNRSQSRLNLGNITLTDATGSRSWIPAMNRFVINKASPGSDPLRSFDTIWRTILRPDLNESFGSEYTSHVITTSSERTNLDGRATIKFTQIFTSGGGGWYVATVWADPQTHRAVKIGGEQYSGDGNLVMSDAVDEFEYNKEPPANVFRLAIPKGASVKVYK